MVESNPINSKYKDDVNVELLRNEKSRNFLKENLLLITTLLGIAFGIITGILLRPYKLSNDTIMLIAYPGELFMRMLKLVTLPMLIASLVTVSANLNARMSGKIVIRTIIYFALTSMLSAFCGITIAMVLQPGDVNAAHDAIQTSQKTKFLDSILDLGRNLFADNIFEATFKQTMTIYVSSKGNDSIINDVRELTHRSGTNSMGIVVFCLAFGSFLNTMDERGQVVKDFFSTTFEVTLKMITKIIWLTSVAVASIIAAKILSIEKIWEVFSQLTSFIFCVLLGLTFHQLVMLPAIYFVVLRKQPYTFLVKLIDPWITAFAAASSAVTLPTTLHCMNEKMKKDSRISSFVLTLGVSLNTNGGAMFLAMSSIFMPRLDGATLTYGILFTILLMATIASMSMPSVPSASLVMLLVILTTMSTFGIYRCCLQWIGYCIRLDRCRTTSNVIGDCFAAVVLEQMSKKDLMKMDAVELHQKSDNGTFVQSV